MGAGTARFAWAICLCLIAVGQARADGDPANQYRNEITQAERLGRQIYERDRAASVATDVAFKESDMGRDERMRGWIEELIGRDAWKIVFYGEIEGATAPLYSVDVKNGRAVSASLIVYAPGTAFTEAQAVLVKAREIAVRQKVQLCSRYYNTTVIPAEAGRYYVYLLAATVDPGEVWIGGHYRMTVDPYSATVTQTKKFSNSCFMIRKPPVEQSEAVAALFATHVLAPYPEENHVFVSFQQGIEIYVRTEAGLWSVSKGKITFVDRLQ